MIAPKPSRYGHRLAARLLAATFPPGREPEGRDQWAREVMNREVGSRLDELTASECHAIEVSGEAHRSRPWLSYRSLQWPEFDLCDLTTPVEPADVVIAEQVLEHVARPWDAVSNLRRMCRDGGVVVVTTPFMLRRHEEPKDYWRFTEDGLEVLFSQAGLQVETTGSWGNWQCVIANFHTWPRRRRGYSLRNQPDLPVVVWAFGTPSRVDS